MILLVDLMCHNFFEDGESMCFHTFDVNLVSRSKIMQINFFTCKTEFLENSDHVEAAVSTLNINKLTFAFVLCPDDKGSIWNKFVQANDSSKLFSRTRNIDAFEILIDAAFTLSNIKPNFMQGCIYGKNISVIHNTVCSSQSLEQFL